MALRFVSVCFSTDAVHLIDIALNRDVLTNYQILLCSHSTDLVREALWGLSNITASSKDHVALFFQQEVLIERILTLMSNKNNSIQ